MYTPSIIAVCPGIPLKGSPDFFYCGVLRPTATPLNIMLSLATSAIILASVLFTSFLSGILGMAGGMVLMGILAWILPIQAAMVLHAVAQFFSNGSRAFIHRAHIHKPSIKFYLAGLALCFTIFSFGRYVPDKMVVFAFLGAGPFLPFLLPKKWKPDFTIPWQAFFCGVIVTTFQLTGGVSGPLLDTFFQTRKLSRHETIATKAFTQAISHVTKFVYFGLVVTTLSDASGSLPLWLYFAVVPTAMAGSNLAKHVLHRLSDAQFYKATQVALLVIGTVYLYKAVHLWMTSQAS
jgi:uncharacterized protein